MSVTLVKSIPRYLTQELRVETHDGGAVIMLLYCIVQCGPVEAALKTGTVVSVCLSDGTWHITVRTSDDVTMIMA